MVDSVGTTVNAISTGGAVVVRSEDPCCFQAGLEGARV